MREAAGKLYKPLKPWQSRVLRLHAGEDVDYLRADLLVAGLAHEEGFLVSEDSELNLVHYEAISYCWGTADFRNTILVNGIKYRISSSLAGALRVFRSVDSARHLWADALCINQYDDEEKSQQVSKMKSIFSMASGVLVWLGQEGLHSTAAIAALNSGPPLDLNSLTEEALEGLLDICSRSWPRRVWYVCLQHKFEYRFFSSFSFMLFLLLCALANASCRRVQQEVYFARAIWIFCGTSNLSMGLYDHGASLIDRKSEDFELAYPGITSGINAIDNLSVPSAAGSKDLRELDLATAEASEASGVRGGNSDLKCSRFAFEAVWHRFGSINATDARDYVYGLLGMTFCEVVPLKSDRTPGPLALQVNYGLSVSQVFQQMTKHVINRDAALSLFAENFTFGTAATDLELPSWTINWSIQPPSEPRHCYGLAARCHRDSKRDSRERRPWFVDFEGRAHVGYISVQNGVVDGNLHLTGCILCTIQEVSFRCRDDYYDTLEITVSSRLRKENSEKEASQFVLDGAGPRKCTTHKLDICRCNSFGVERSIVTGDILAQIDGVDASYLCLRPRQDGRYAIVCQLSDVFLLQGEAAVVFGGYNVDIRLSTESRREFIIC